MGRKIIFATLTLVIINDIINKIRINTNEEKWSMKITKSTQLNIVIPSKETPRERFAATECVKYLNKICGVNAQIYSDAQTVNGAVIAIGGPERNAFTAMYISEAEFDKIVPGPEGIYIKSFDNCLILAGSSKNANERERGTIYATYEFLERFLGCALCAYVKVGVPGGEYIPVLEEIILKDVFYTKAKSDVYERGACVQYSDHGVPQDYVLDKTFLDWLCKNRYNHIYTWNCVYEHYKENGILDEALKRGFILETGHHDTIDTILPQRGNKYFPEHYFETHPEYYRLNEDGSRFEMVSDWGQLVLCSRNEEMIEQAANNLIAWLDQNPMVKAYSWVNKDGTFPQCCCEKCKPFNKTENSLYMINEIAKRVYKAHPDVLISNIAYTDVWEPPENFGPLSPNLMVNEAVWHVSGLRKTGKPDGSCLIGTFFEENLLAWQEKFNVNIDYYDYFMGVYPGRQRLVPMADEMQALCKRMVEKNIYGLKTQIELYNMWNNIMNFYTFGRTAYDVELTLEDNIRSFTRIFGAGAQYVAENIRYVEQMLDGQCEIMTAGVYLMNHIDKERVYANYDKALAAAEGDAVARNNIRMMRMAFRYSDLESREEYANDEIGYTSLKHYDIPERGELLYMRDHFDSYVSFDGYGIDIPVEGEDNGFTPDIWYLFDE